jgi:hypothetical protein
MMILDTRRLRRRRFALLLTLIALQHIRASCALTLQPWLRISDTTSDSASMSPRTYAASVSMPTAGGIRAASNQSTDWTTPGLEQFVLIGGHRLPENYLQDIFVSPSNDAVNWTNRHDDAKNPSPWQARYGAIAMRADATNRSDARILLIGGVGVNLEFLSDVWTTSDPEFASSSWTLLSDGQFPPRAFHCAVSLDAGRTIVVWAGYALGADCWISTDGGRTFTQQPVPYWPNRFAAACTATSAGSAGSSTVTETLWMIGGEAGEVRRPTREVWYSQDRGVNWHQQSLYPFPGARRSYAAYAYGSLAIVPSSAGPSTTHNASSSVQALILQGGVSSAGWPSMLNDTWMTIDCQHWTQLSSIDEVGRSGHALLVNSVGRLYVMTGQTEGGMESGMESNEVWRYEGEPQPAGSSAQSDDDDYGSIRWIIAITVLVSSLLIGFLCASATYCIIKRCRQRSSGSVVKLQRDCCCRGLLRHARTLMQSCSLLC